MHDGTVFNIQREDTGLYQAFTPDGLYWEVQTWGKPYLAQIVQRSGDTIAIDQGGVIFKAVNGATRQILFQRNSDGLITSISDPMGQTTGGPDAVKYEYDGYGNLIYVERLVDRSAGSYVTNTFLYANANFPHYITDIINADGTQVAKNFYDDSGKLIAVQDANGNLTQFIHNLTNDMEIVVDRLGHTNVLVYDSRGNITSQTNVIGQVTTMAYDDNNNKTNEVTYLNGQPYATNNYF
jgi:YD repeat-containing protein